VILQAPFPVIQTDMKINNINIFRKEYGFQKGSISFENRISEIITEGPEDPDLDYLIPGLIDVHTHGSCGEDFSDGSYDGLCRMSDYYASNGITGFAGTTMTLPYEALKEACVNGYRFSKEPHSGAQLLGIHLEGPYLSYNKRGAQNPDYLQIPDISGFNELYILTEGLVKIISIAPEINSALDFIRAVSDRVTVSVAHTETDYDTALFAFAAGARQLTHTFNAMSPITGRNPGPIIAASENTSVSAEVISDGRHVSPANVRFLFRLFGADRMILISDSLRCCGMPEGSYMLGGQEITVRDGLGYLADGTIAGSASNLFECMKAAVSFGISKEDAVLAATFNPARSLGIDSHTGIIEPGKNADLVLCDRDLGLKSVFISGREYQ